LYKREAELVNEEVLADPMNMNLRLGGHGGWDYANSLGPGKGNRYYRKNNENVKISLAKAKSISTEKITSVEYAETFRKNVSNGVKRHIAENGSWWTGKKHTDETKAKIGAKSAVHQAGKKNSQFGTMWISNMETFVSKKVKKDFVVEYPWVKRTT
jgi:hypothetical protein